MKNINTLIRKWSMLIVVLLSVLNPLRAANADGTIQWGMLIISLFGGLALFLFGMKQMSEGMKKTAGDKMRSILSALTDNRLIGMTVGAFVTMVIQSSSATTVMLVSFVQAQLMTFVQSLGVILGADIGTTNSIKINRLCTVNDCCWFCNQDVF